jgi:nitroreductase
MDDIMDTIEAIRSRRSVRGFTNENVSDEQLTQILEAGRWAPSGLNNQAWRFIIVRNPDTKIELSKLTNYVNKVLEAPDSFELMGIIALGHPVQKKMVSERKELDQIVFREKFGKNR